MLKNIQLNQELKGIYLCLLGYLFVSLIGLSEKSISPSIHVPVILFFQNIVCLILISFDYFKSENKSIKTPNIGFYIIRIASGLGCYALLFFIIRFMPISVAMLYQYTASIWIPLLMLIWFRVRMAKKLWWGIGIGFIGVLLILKPSPSQLNFISLFGILCGLLQGISIISIRKLTQIEPLFRMLFYYFLAGIVVTSPWAFKAWVPLQSKDVVLLLSVGICTYLAQKFLTLSVKYACPTTLAPLCYVSIFYSGFIAWMIWGEIPTTLALVGMGLVISGCFLTIKMTSDARKINPAPAGTQ